MRAATRMTEHVQAYLSLRRAFGFHLSIAGQVLQSFARFAGREAPGKPFSVELALRWAQSSPTGKQVSAARRLLILQPFARYLRTVEPVTEVLPNRLLGPAQYRYLPHIYTDVEIQALLGKAAGLSSPGGLRARTVQTYLGLLACTGMRPQEPLRLTRADVDLPANVLPVRQTKFSKSRFVPLDRTVAGALRDYARTRDHLVRYPPSAVFFLSDDGSALTYKKALWAFQGLRRKLGWIRKQGSRLPRLYDLRHTFVCHRLLEWQRDGVDVQVALPSLSTYLGHLKITDTYWYITALPELMDIVSERFERFVWATLEEPLDDQ
jgi:integrase